MPCATRNVDVGSYALGFSETGCDAFWGSCEHSAEPDKFYSRWMT